MRVGQPTSAQVAAAELLGGTVGANLQKGMFVFGVEGDLAWTNKSGRGADDFTTL